MALIQRPRRLRTNPILRQMVRENHLSIDNFIYPLFIKPGKNIKNPISSLSGQYHLSVDEAVKKAKKAFALGIPALLLFGLPTKKDDLGEIGAAPNGPVQSAIKAIKDALPQMIIITDVCLCEYTTHGHCGVLKNNLIDNDATLELLAQQALSHAQAGADIVAPSDMMDGRVAAIRKSLDEASFSNTAIMSYSVKYTSAFYGPFREAADSTPKQGDRRSYQMDPANVKEALKEIHLDTKEGADFLMVKPAGPYLDILAKVVENSLLPVAAYQVSGEFAMLKAAAKAGLFDEKEAFLESLLAIKRAGAQLIITYYALEAAKCLSK